MADFMANMAGGESWLGRRVAIRRSQDKAYDEAS
jgi:hypothetical protein